MSDEQLKALANDYFGAYPEEDVLYISSDGQVFLKKNQSDAVNHQARIDGKTPLKELYREKTPLPAEDDGDEVPDETYTKDEIVEWLTARGIQAEIKEKKNDLLEKVLEAIKADSGEGDDDETNE